jgi:two-component system, OmpR family, phosphate regulon sensor histidine kinase PhoR
MFRSIRWRIALPTIVLVLLVTVVLALYVSHVMQQETLSNLETQLVEEARLVAAVAKPLLAAGADTGAVQPVVRRLGQMVAARVTIIGPDGVVLGDSFEDPAQMENHLDRLEVQRALSEGIGVENRFSRTLAYRMMYTAVSIKDGETVLGIARLALPVTEAEARIARLRNTVVSVALTVGGIAGLLVLLTAESVVRPLRRVTRLVERFAQGDLDERLYVGTKDELGRLAHTFNWMADQLDSRLNELIDQRNTLEAVLTLMADGVIITTRDERVELINPAAAGILGVSRELAVGQRFVTVARDHQVVEVWRQCQRDSREQSDLVDMIGARPILQVMVTPLREGGCLVLLQDLTKIRRLETVRRDFITNISHELRTPLASLRALVETLQDGALQDPPAAHRFLGLIDVEVDALTQMVEELLELSRIESGRVPLRMVPTTLEEIVEPAVERMHQQAGRADVRLVVDLPAGLPPVLADGARAAQVVTNLVHNAIKFTPKKGTVTVSAASGDDQVVVSVADTGIGIAADDLPRIFERFYKADHARSGGGTGLGLAIARHIVEAHGGRIWAQSMEGQGSTFYFALPAADRPGGTSAGPAPIGFAGDEEE